MKCLTAIISRTRGEIDAWHLSPLMKSITAMLSRTRDVFNHVLNFTSRVQDKELRDIRDRMQDKEGELDTLRRAGKNLRERLDEKEVETRGIMDRVSQPLSSQVLLK